MSGLKKSFANKCLNAKFFIFKGCLVALFGVFVAASFYVQKANAHICFLPDPAECDQVPYNEYCTGGDCPTPTPKPEEKCSGYSLSADDASAMRGKGFTCEKCVDGDLYKCSCSGFVSGDECFTCAGLGYNISKDTYEQKRAKGYVCDKCPGGDFYSGCACPSGTHEEENDKCEPDCTDPCPANHTDGKHYQVDKPGEDKCYSKVESPTCPSTGKECYRLNDTPSCSNGETLSRAGGICTCVAQPEPKPVTGCSNYDFTTNVSFVCSETSSTLGSALYDTCYVRNDGETLENTYGACAVTRPENFSSDCKCFKCSDVGYLDFIGEDFNSGHGTSLVSSLVTGGHTLYLLRDDDIGTEKIYLKKEFENPYVVNRILEPSSECFDDEYYYSHQTDCDTWYDTNIGAPISCLVPYAEGNTPVIPDVAACNCNGVFGNCKYSAKGAPAGKSGKIDKFKKLLVLEDEEDQDLINLKIKMAMASPAMDYNTDYQDALAECAGFTDRQLSLSDCKILNGYSTGNLFYQYDPNASYGCTSQTCTSDNLYSECQKVLFDRYCFARIELGKAAISWTWSAGKEQFNLDNMQDNENTCLMKDLPIIPHDNPYSYKFYNNLTEASKNGPWPVLVEHIRLHPFVAYSQAELTSSMLNIINDNCPIWMPDYIDYSNAHFDWSEPQHGTNSYIYTNPSKRYLIECSVTTTIGWDEFLTEYTGPRTCYNPLASTNLGACAQPCRIYGMETNFDRLSFHDNYSTRAYVRDNAGMCDYYTDIEECERSGVSESSCQKYYDRSKYCDARFIHSKCKNIADSYNKIGTTTNGAFTVKITSY